MAQTKKTTKEKYAKPEFYEKKLAKVMERFEVKKDDYNWDYMRQSAWVEFRYKGNMYRFEHSVANAVSHNVKIESGTDAFAQIVLALEDLARISQRGIYDLQTWVAGLKLLPEVVTIPSFIKFLGFDYIPAEDEIKERFRKLAKQMHPDTGGNAEDFDSLKKATESAIKYIQEIANK